MNIIECGITAPNAKIAIVIARFNYSINQLMLNGAIDTLKRIGQVKDENITIIKVPGSYEISLTTNILANSGKYEAIIALGTIIKGYTEHFKFISSECSSNLSTISIRAELPVIFGILITENIDQAIERSGIKFKNRGEEAALAALEMINIISLLKHE